MSNQVRTGVGLVAFLVSCVLFMAVSERNEQIEALGVESQVLQKQRHALEEDVKQVKRVKSEIARLRSEGR